MTLRTTPNTDFAKLLEDGWEFQNDHNAHSSRLEYLSDYIFEFTTYDTDMGELFASKAVEFCVAVQNRTTFEYIEKPEQHKWFLVMANMGFFKERISWGTSVRAAFWYVEDELNTTGLFDGDNQVTELAFTPDSWRAFIAAIIAFAAKE